MIKAFAMIFCTIVIFISTSVTAFADCGPKPSTTVFVRGVESKREYYATLLCDKDWLPPGHSAYDGDDPEYIALKDDAWRAFYEYAKTDEYNFLQVTFKRKGNGSLSWGYYPPSRFKVALYFPDNGAVFVSEPREALAFSSYFTAEVKEGELKVSRSNNIGGMAVGAGAFLIRLVITILIELVMAAVFGIRSRGAVKLILSVNIVTQLLLNIVLTAFSLTLGIGAGLFVYVPLEILIFAAEAGIYAANFSELTDGKIKGGKAVLYSLAANAASFAIGGVICALLSKLAE